MESIKELCEQRVKLYEENKALLAKADGESRSLNSEEKSAYDKRDAEIDALADKIKDRTDHETRKQRLSSLEGEFNRPLPRQTAATAIKPSAGETLSFDFGKAGNIRLPSSHPLYNLGTAEYEQVFGSYLRGERGDWESLGLQVANDPKGGYTVPLSFMSEVIKFLDDEVLMRRLCRTLPPTNAKSVGMVSFDTDYADADWSAEVPASDISEDDAARFGTREMTPHLLTKLIKAGQKLIRSSSIGIESFVAQRAGYRFAITENKAFLTGSGSQRPLGVFTASNDGVPTTRDTTCASTTTFTMDELMDVKYNVKAPYQMRGIWLTSRTFMKTLRKLKYGTGEYMLGINGEPDRLLDRPIYQDENAPATFTTGQYIAIFFDPQFYWIQDSISMQMQRLDELFALKNQVGWVFRKETDAMPVLAEAFSRLKLG